MKVDRYMMEKARNAPKYRVKNIERMLKDAWVDGCDAREMSKYCLKEGKIMEKFFVPTYIGSLGSLFLLTFLNSRQSYLGSFGTAFFATIGGAFVWLASITGVPKVDRMLRGIPNYSKVEKVAEERRKAMNGEYNDAEDISLLERNVT